MQHPDQESNQDLDFRRVLCDPPRFQQTLALDIWGRRLDSHQHQPLLLPIDRAKPVPSYSATSAKHECKESNPPRLNKHWPATQAGVRTTYTTDTIPHN